MGNSNSVEESSIGVSLSREFLNLDFKYFPVRDIVDEHYGLVRLMKCKETNEIIATLSLEIDEKREYNKIFEHLERSSQRANSKLVTRLVHFDTEVEERFLFDTKWKVFTAFEYLSNNLKNELNNFKAQGCLLTQEGFLYLIEAMIEILHEFQRRETVHGYIKPFNIMITSEGKIKVLDSFFSIINRKRLIKQMISGRENYYVAPTLFSIIKGNSYLSVSVAEHIKFDVFSVGMTLIESALLVDMSKCYDYEQEKFLPRIIDGWLIQIERIYGLDVAKIVAMMCELEESLRPGIATLRIELSRLKNLGWIFSDRLLFRRDPFNRSVIGNEKLEPINEDKRKNKGNSDSKPNSDCNSHSLDPSSKKSSDSKVNPDKKFLSESKPDTKLTTPNRTDQPYEKPLGSFNLSLSDHIYGSEKEWNVNVGAKDFNKNATGKSTYTSPIIEKGTSSVEKGRSSVEKGRSNMDRGASYLENGTSIMEKVVSSVEKGSSSKTSRVEKETKSVEKSSLEMKTNELDSLMSIKTYNDLKFPNVSDKLALGIYNNNNNTFKVDQYNNTAGSFTYGNPSSLKVSGYDSAYSDYKLIEGSTFAKNLIDTNENIYTNNYKGELDIVFKTGNKEEIGKGSKKEYLFTPEKTQQLSNLPPNNNSSGFKYLSSIHISPDEMKNMGLEKSQEKYGNNIAFADPYELKDSEYLRNNIFGRSVTSSRSDSQLASSWMPEKHFVTPSIYGYSYDYLPSLENKVGYQGADSERNRNNAPIQDRFFTPNRENDYGQIPNSNLGIGGDSGKGPKGSILKRNRTPRSSGSSKKVTIKEEPIVWKKEESKVNEYQRRVDMLLQEVRLGDN